MCCLVSVFANQIIWAIKNHSQSVIGEQLRVLCHEHRLNMLYQRVDVEASGSKFFEGKTVLVCEFISSIIEDHVVVQSVEYFFMLPRRLDWASCSIKPKTVNLHFAKCLICQCWMLQVYILSPSTRHLTMWARCSKTWAHGLSNWAHHLTTWAWYLMSRVHKCRWLVHLSFPVNHQSDSIALLCRGAVSGNGLVSMGCPIPCGFRGSICGQCAEQDALIRPAANKLRLLTIGFVRAISQLSAALVIHNWKIGHSHHYILFVSF